MFDPVHNSNNILVNILPLDEQALGTEHVSVLVHSMSAGQARGGQHFQQTRAHEWTPQICGGSRGFM